MGMNERETQSGAQVAKVTPEFEAQAEDLISRYPVSRRSATLPLLHLWQNTFGSIDDSGVEWIAARVGVGPVQVVEVITFYPWFRRKSAGRTIIRVCRTLSCALAGSHDIKEKFCQAVGVDPHSHSHGFGAPPPTAPDGEFSVEFVECLACCGSAPVALINDDLHERIQPEDVPAIVKKYQS